MLGALNKTTARTQTRRTRLIAEAGVQRHRMTAYLDAFDPTAHWVERLINAVKFIIDRPLIPAGIVAAVVIAKPRRAVKIGLLVWRVVAWIRRIKSTLR